MTRYFNSFYYIFTAPNSNNIISLPSTRYNCLTIGDKGHY